MLKKLTFFIFLWFCANSIFAQVPIKSYLTFDGHYDFTMFGNTNNVKGNTTDNSFDCQNDNKSSSSAVFVLPSGNPSIERAILYWAGTGSGDKEVKLSGPNGLTNQTITASKVYVDYLASSGGAGNYFSASYDVTSILQAHGTGQYRVSELDVPSGAPYCPQTMFSGWFVVVVYEDSALPLNTVKLYDGFRGISQTTINFNLDGININNPNGAKLAFVVWEGDNFPSLGYEGMKVNNHPLSNSLNPAGQIYNSTNTFSNKDKNYNMDMDYFDISNDVQAGDQQIKITATASQDVIFFNVYAITFNNELPDATVKIKNHTGTCDNRDITITYTVYNDPANDTLPKGADVSFYANSTNGIFLGTQKTTQALAIGDSLTQTIVLTIPASLGYDFPLFAVVDDGDVITELQETNNTFQYLMTMPSTFNEVDNQGICEGDTLYWGGQIFTTPISQDFFFTSIYGCDSTVHLNLDVQKNVTTYIDTGICQNAVFILPDGDTITEPGDYTSILSTQYGCDSTIYTHLVRYNESHIISISGQDLIHLGYSTPLVLFSNFTPDSIQWIPSFSLDCDSCAQVNATPFDNTLYTAWVYDDNGCLLQDSFQVSVFKPDEVYIPNAFSPNGDGRNDLFEVYTDKDVNRILRFQVFDRWGNLIFDQKTDGVGFRNGWNGYYKDKRMDSDVFAYQIVVEFLDGRTKLFAGDVTLIR